MRSLIIAAPLAACAAGTSPEAESARNVCAIAYGDPALDPVCARIPFDDDAAAKAPMSVLADPDRPSAPEREALARLDAANRRCWDAWDKAGASPTVQAARAKVSAALGALYSGAGSYGEFNRQRATAIAEMRAAIEEQRRRGYAPPRGPFTLGVGLGVFR